MVKRDMSPRNDALSLPGDCRIGVYPKDVQEWFIENGLTSEDLIDHDITWSESRQSVVFPYYDPQGKLFAYQCRTFNGDPRKWLTYGNINSNFVVVTPEKEDDEHLCVVVEDVVSAIRVGHVATAMPLFGTGLDEKRTSWLLDFYKRVIFWLDADAVPKAMLHSRKFSVLGGANHDAYVLKTQGDPKSYTEAQIREFINTTVEKEDADASDSEALCLC